MRRYAKHTGYRKQVPGLRSTRWAAKQRQVRSAFVVMNPGQQMTAEEVMKFCQEKLAKYKVPTAVEFIDALQKSGVGKILRKELKAAELEKMKTAK